MDMFLHVQSESVFSGTNLRYFVPSTFTLMPCLDLWSMDSTLLGAFTCQNDARFVLLLEHI